MNHVLGSAHAATPPEGAEGSVTLRPPPRLEARAGSGVLMNVIPVLGSLGSIAMVASMSAAGGGRGRGLLAGGLLLFTTVGFVVVQISNQRQQRRHQVGAPRTAYLTYLAGVRATVREVATAQRRTMVWHQPEPRSLPALVQARTGVRKRSPGDPRFLHVRYGVCHQPLALDLVEPLQEAADVDPAAANAMTRFVRAHRMQPDLPGSLDLRAHHRIEIEGSAASARGLTRALICSGTTSHAPEHLIVAVLTTQERLTYWDWIKWLPHAGSARHADAVGPRRMVATSPRRLVEWLPADLGERRAFGVADGSGSPHVLLVVDGAGSADVALVVPPGGLDGVTIIGLPGSGEAEPCPRLRLADTDPAGACVSIRATAPGVVPLGAVADQCSLAVAEAVARRLLASTDGPIQGAAQDVHDVHDVHDFMTLVGAGDVRRLDPGSSWLRRSPRERLRIPIGIDDNGAVVHLDLKESAERGMGPHGLCIGATGAGKSEFLRTLVLGIAVTHSPEHLNLVLVDFKGGATFAGMARLPHVSAVITNLAEELTLVDRMQDALTGEIVRRQELLRAAGNFASVRDYEKARAAGAELAPLPSLFIVVDEFSELLSAKPEFIDLFVAIGRLGRSLGLHLLLASQRLEEGRLRGLESHLSYRIGLRTFSAQESRSVLGVPDAYELPAQPGLGYLKADPTSLVRFKAAYVSGPASSPPVRRTEVPATTGILPFTICEVLDGSGAGPCAAPPAPGAEEYQADHPGDQETLLAVAVDRLAGHGATTRRIWLPPLGAPDTLDGLMGDLAEDPHLGLVSPSWRAQGNLTVPVGTVDRPREQRRDTLAVHLGGAGGHVGVVGGARSGKSTLLRTIVASTALVATPSEVQFFVLDFGGGTFTSLAELPHLAGLASRSDPDVVRRMVAEVSGIVDRREGYFRTHGIDSIETYRARRREGRTDDGYGDVFLVVDGWATLRSDFDEIETEIQHLAGRGLAYGLHLVTSAARWADFRAGLRDQLGTRLELRLGDPLDSEVDRRVAALVPRGRPGRGLIADTSHFLAALPRLDGLRAPDDLGEGVEHLVAGVADAWRGPSGPKLRLLPDLIELDRVREAARRELGRSLLLGVNEKDLGPVTLDPDHEPHLLIFGESRSGKSAALRGYVREVMRTRSAARAQILVVDYRRSLLGEVSPDYRLDYLTSDSTAQPALRELADYLAGRLPGPEVTSDQLRGRSWWSGAEVFVVVDDYDLVATQQGSPVAHLQPLLAQARDVGLHVVVARRSGGASRSLYEPVIQSLRDLATPGLLLSGSPEEGPLLGNLRPQPQTPGRGRLITRDRGVETVQLGWTAPLE